MPRKSLLRIAGAVLLASAATGCSSDATRFSGLFSDTDSLTTASIPQRQGSGAYGQAPVPRGDLNSGMAAAPVVDYGSRSAATSQPYPGNNGSGYSSVASPARSAAAPAAVQRAELAPPGGSTSSQGGDDFASRQQAMAQSFPSAQQSVATTAQAPTTNADNVTTGTVRTSAGW